MDIHILAHLNKLLKYITYVPACLSITKDGVTDYYMPVVISYSGVQIFPYYVKFPGTLEDFKKASQKEMSAISSLYYYYTNLDASNSFIEHAIKDKQTKELNQFNNTIELSESTLTDIVSILYKNAANGGLLSIRNQSISDIRNSYNIGIKSELIELNKALPFTLYAICTTEYIPVS